MTMRILDYSAEYVPNGYGFKDVDTYDDFSGVRKTKTLLVIRPELRDCYDVIQYRSLADEPSLYRRFAQIGNKEEVLKFASNFGFLRTRDLHPGLEETLKSWQDTISWLRLAISIWESIRTQDVQNLLTFFAYYKRIIDSYSFGPETLPMYAPCKRYRVLSYPLLPDGACSARSNTDITKNGILFLQRTLRLGLYRSVEPVFLRSMCLKPTCLNGAMWLQLAQSIEREIGALTQDPAFNVLNQYDNDSGIFVMDYDGPPTSLDECQ